MASLLTTVRAVECQAVLLGADCTLAALQSHSSPAPLAAAALNVPAAPPALLVAQQYWPKAVNRMVWILLGLLISCLLLVLVIDECKQNQHGVNTLATASITTILQVPSDTFPPSICAAGIKYSSHHGRLHTSSVGLATIDGACGGDNWVGGQIQICYNWHNPDMVAFCFVCPWYAGPWSYHAIWYLERLLQVMTMVAAICAFPIAVLTMN